MSWEDAMYPCFVAAGDSRRRELLCVLADQLGYDPVPLTHIAHTYAYLRRPPAALIIDQGPYLLDGDPTRIERQWPTRYKPATVVIPEGREIDREYLRIALEEEEERLLKLRPAQLSFDFEGADEEPFVPWLIAAE